MTFNFFIDLSFRFNIVILIQPSNNLNSIFPVFLRNQLNHLLNDAAFTKKIVREQKLGIVSNLLEHSRKHAIQGIALSNQKILIQFVIVVGFLVSIDFFHVESVQLHMDCLCQNLRLECVILIGKNTHSGREVTINLHEAQCGETIKPRVGNLLHNLLISFFLNLLNQGSSLLLLGRRKQMTTHTIVIWISDLFIRNTISKRPLAHTGD